MKLHKKFNHDLPDIYYYGETSEIPLRINVGRFESDYVSVDKLHYLKTRTTYFCVIEGSIVFEVNGKEVTITSDAALEVEPKEVYKILRIGSEGCTYFVVGSHNNASTDKVVIED